MLGGEVENRIGNAAEATGNLVNNVSDVASAGTRVAVNGTVKGVKKANAWAYKKRMRVQSMIGNALDGLW